MARVSLELYRHNESDKALLLSRDGRRPKWIPLSQVNEPPSTRIVSVEGVKLAKGKYEIEEWIAKREGLLDDTEDADQGDMQF